MGYIRLLALFLPVWSATQPGHLNDPVIVPADTLTLNETVVSGKGLRQFGAGHTLYIADSITMARHQDHTLEKLIGRQTGIYLKQYGPGILATTSMRGGSASQTAMMWNGFPLQSPLHGQQDLSLIPVFFTDEAGVEYGGGTAFLGSGAMGGSIHLNNRMPDPDGWAGRASLRISSLKDRWWQGDLSFGQTMVATRIRFFSRHADNEYNYRDTSLESRPVRTQQHAALDQRGLLYETYYRSDRHQAAIRLWWQENNRHIPPPLSSSYQGAFQEDEHFRLTAEWRTGLKNSLFQWRGGYFKESVSYQDNQYLVSRSASETLTQEANLLSPLSHLLTTNTRLQASYIQAESDEYLDRPTTYLVSLNSSWRWALIPDNLELLATARQTIAKDHTPPFTPSFSFSWQAGRFLMVKANAGKNYRIPTLNDKYWNPGGNPDLKPESGWSQDIGISFSNHEHRVKRPTSRLNPTGLEFDWSINGYHRQVNHWIIWQPQAGSMRWSPENLLEVRSYGKESRVRIEKKSGNWIINVTGHWDHTIARNTFARSPGDASKNKQLIYVPKNTAGYHIDIAYKQTSLHLHHQITGKRYTATDHSSWLASYHTGNLRIRHTITKYGYTASLFAEAENLWNESYQLMAGRPMPLRYVHTGISFTF